MCLDGHVVQGQSTNPSKLLTAGRPDAFLRDFDAYGIELIADSLEG